MLKIVIVLLCVIVLDRLIPKQGAWQPNSWLDKLTALNLTLTRPALSKNAPNRHIAWGLLAWLLQISLIFPLLAIPYVIPDQIGVFDLLALYLALDISAKRTQLRSIQESIRKNDLVGAKSIAKVWLECETSSYNAYELNRAIFEHFAIHYFRSVLVVLFWFIVLGAPGAWLYWLSFHLNQVCARSGNSLQYFRIPAQRFCDYAEWLPARIFGITLLITTHPFQTWRCWRNQAWTWNSLSETLVLAVIGGRLRLMLGGPGNQYNQTVMRPYLGEGNPVTVRDLARVDGLLNLCLWRWILTLTFLAWVIYQPLDLETSL